MASYSTPKTGAFNLTILKQGNPPQAREEFKQHVVAGLSKPEKALPSRYLYDDRGSELYRRITELDEYYLTRAENEILRTYANSIVSKYFVSTSEKEPLNVVELGAGDGRKTKILLQALLDKNVNFEYMPIDISRLAMTQLFEAMGSYFKDQPLKVHGIIGDYMECIEHIMSIYPSRRTVVLFIGSSIGNFTFDGALDFLSQLWSKLNPRDFLFIGCDLRKDCEIMRRAYFDSQGVTTAFNLNLLTRMNRELGMDFCAENFQHLAIYNPRTSAMESYLLSKKEHTVKMKGTETQASGHITINDTKEFSFNAFEPIHLELSFKYTPQLVHDLLQGAGFVVNDDFFDSQKWFVDTLAEVRFARHG